MPSRSAATSSRSPASRSRLVAVMVPSAVRWVVHVTTSRRCLGGSAAIAAPSSSTWSAAVAELALPRRSVPAGASPVLSQ